MSHILALIITQAIPLVVQTYFYALCTILTVYVLYQRWAGQKSIHPSGFMVSVALMMFFLFTLYWLINVYKLWATAYMLSLDVESSDAEHHASVKINMIVGRLSIGQAPALFLMLTLGDMVSLWRAYVITGRPRWMYMLSIGIIVVEFALWITDIVQLSIVIFPEHVNFLVELVSVSTVACAQLLSTLLIAYKAWAHWRAVREFAGPSNVQRSIAMLAVVVESGVAYLAILICYAALNSARLTPTVTTTLDVLEACIVPLIAMYPTSIIVLVAARLAVLERSIGSVTAHSGLVFAAPPAGRQGSTDYALRSQYHTHDYDTPHRVEFSLGPSKEPISNVLASQDDDGEPDADI